MNNVKEGKTGECCNGGGECCGAAGSHGQFFHEGGGSYVKKSVVLVAVVLSIFLAGKAIAEWRALPYAGIDAASRPTVNVSGMGEVVVKPDIATISYVVQEESMVVATAQNNAAKKSNDILAALKKQGVAEKDIKTSGYNIYPRYEYPRTTAIYDSGKQVLAGYVVTQNFEVKVRKLEDAGTIVSSLGELGATGVSGLAFGIDEEEGVLAQARAKAVADAQKKAEVLARDLGVRLVRIVGFSEGGGGYYPMARYDSMKVMAAGAESITPELPTGENKITSNVTITYEIR